MLISLPIVHHINCRKYILELVIYPSVLIAWPYHVGFLFLLMISFEAMQGM
jgi:hypothetical protein